MMRHAGFGHVVTRISAALAGVGTEAHLVVVGEALTGRLALLADLGAGGAGIGMQIGSAEHEIGAGLADFGAIHQQADVSGFAHLAALREAVGHGQHADALAIAAVLNALLHVMSCHVKIHWTSVAIW